MNYQEHLNPHASRLAEFYAGFQNFYVQPPRVTSTEPEVHRAWTEECARRLTAADAAKKQVQGQIEHIIRSQAKDSWFEPARPTAADIDFSNKAGTDAVKKPFSIVAAFQSMLGSQDDNPGPEVISKKTGDYVYYKISRQLIFAIDEKDAFSPIWVFDSTKDVHVHVVSRPVALVKVGFILDRDREPSKSDGGVNRSILSGTAHTVELKRTSSSDYWHRLEGLKWDFDLRVDTGDSRDTIRWKGSDEPKLREERLAVLNEFFEAMSRKAVRSLHALKTVIGPLKPLPSSQWVESWAFMGLHLHEGMNTVNPYTAYYDSSLLPGGASAPRIVRVISD